MRYLITGHTGFKGSWISLLLSHQGHSVHGLALDPEPGSLFDIAAISHVIDSDTRGDIRDPKIVRKTTASVEPDIIIHMAAQPQVLESYQRPRWTLETNVMGTLSVLEAAAMSTSTKAVIVVTTDKVYRNNHQKQGYRESDPLGGNDPYSASKAMADILTQSWATSFGGPKTATVRAGNVIGGGDVSTDRLLPHVVRACQRGQQPVIRHPQAVRPWQHVLDCLNGYLTLAETLLRSTPESSNGGAWNFGPSESHLVPVSDVVATTMDYWGSPQGWVLAEDATAHEAELLVLNADKSAADLQWRDRLTINEAIHWTVDWHKRVDAGADPRVVTVEQVERFMALQ